MLTEDELVIIFVRHFEKENMIVKTEIANVYRSADIAVLTKGKEVLIAECKLSNMKQAIKQCKTHQMTADNVVICTTFKHTKNYNVDLLKKFGIGLFYLMPDGTINEFLEPRKNEKLWLKGKAILLNTLQMQGA